jgi:hypothetical protein
MNAYNQMAIAKSPFERMLSEHVAHIPYDQTQWKYIEKLYVLMSHCRYFFSAHEENPCAFRFDSSRQSASCAEEYSELQAVKNGV